MSSSSIQPWGITSPRAVRPAAGGFGGVTLGVLPALLLGLLVSLLLVLLTAAPVLAAGDANEASCPAATEASPGFRSFLPDCRAFEMVTPPYKEGYALAFDGSAEDGSRLLGHSLGSFAGNGAAPVTRTSLGLYYEFTRAADGWHTTPVTPENPQFRDASSFDTASHDLSRTLFRLPTAPVGEDDFYVRGPGSTLADVGPTSPPADGPTQDPAPTGPASVFAVFEGASADLSHIVFKQFPEFAWIANPGNGKDLYEYVGTGNAAPQLVAVAGGYGSMALIGGCGAEVGGLSSTSKFNAVSETGATVFFTPQPSDSEACGQVQPAVAELYARVDESRTVLISAVECHSGCAGGPVSDNVFQGASRDGSSAFFLSTQKLTEQASEDTTPGDSAFRAAGSGCEEARGSGCNLYEYEGVGTAGGHLVTLSAGSATPHVQGVVRVSEDGSHVYFVAQGKLTNAANARNEVAQDGANNLYVFERGAGAGGQTRFIVALAPSEERGEELTSQDAEVWGDVRDSDSERPAQATPDGSSLVFDSHADLTPDDTSSGVRQVFEYDAPTGALRRVSIGDEGFNNNGNTSQYDATIGEFSASGSARPLPNSLWLSNDGRYVFFTSADFLVAGMGSPAAGSATPNVYEYYEGHVYLIYGGNGTRTAFLGTSASGSDAFFYSLDQLVPEDTDTQMDVYDARIDGGPPVHSAAGGCAGEACQGALGAVPSVLGAGSALQPGGDNLAALASPRVRAKPQSPAELLAARRSKALRACRAKRPGRLRRGCEAAVRRRYRAGSKASSLTRSTRGSK